MMTQNDALSPCIVMRTLIDMHFFHISFGHSHRLTTRKKPNSAPHPSVSALKSSIPRALSGTVTNWCDIITKPGTKSGSDRTLNHPEPESGNVL